MESLDALFLNAREISNPAERAAYLAKACGADADLRARVETMLRDAEGAEDFFGPEDGLAHAAGAPLTEGPGTVIGRYKLLQKIGEGGMGVVYMAEQREPVARKLALKIIKLGMDTRQVLGRFEAERQALALMDHPNIAKILDGGATDTGRPYFVMDLVQGLPITRFCDEANLSTRERLELFLEVCSAIQHAHQKGLIHRDIKPANILVTLHGDKPVPKVIDFGIAKATQGRLTEKTIFTQFQHFIGTPAYMSPEQASLSGLDVDTRSDIYGLGVLLYELLTGRAPFDEKELMKAGFDEMRRIIRETEPPRPSTRLMRDRLATRSATSAKSEIRNPKSEIDKDLDWIVMKCLEKDRARRYETANGLAADLKRHLRNEPVIARPPSAGYRFLKLVRRNRIAFAAAGGVMAALLLGLVGSLWQWGRAKRSADEARHAQRETTTNLWHSYLAQARANRFSGRPGRRFDSLEVLAKAAAIRPAPELRDEAIAALALTDVRLTNDWSMRQDGADIGFIYSPELDYYVVNGTNGEGRIHRTIDNAVIGRLPSVGHSISGMGGFSADGRWLLSGGLQGELHVWDVPARKLVLTNLPDSAWAFTPDSRQLLVAGRDRHVSLYDLESASLNRRYPQETVLQDVAAIDPRGRWVAGCTAEGRVLGLYDLATGQSIRRFTNSAEANCLAWRPGGQLLAVGGWDGMLEIWDAQTGERRAKLEGHESTLVAVGFNHAGTLLASSGWDNSWKLWDARDWRQSLTLPSLSYQAQFSPDDRTLAYIGHTGRIHCLEFAPADCFRRMPPNRPVSNSGRDLDLSRDGRLVLSAHLEGFTIWELSSGRELISVTNTACISALFTPDGRSIVTFCRDGVMRWPLTRTVLTNGEEIRIGGGHLIDEGTRWYGAISADGHWSCGAYGFATNLVEIFRLDDPSQRISPGNHTGANNAAFSPDGRWLATGTWLGRGVKVWDLRARKLDREFSELQTAKVEFSPDGRWLATGSHPVELREVGSWSVKWRFDSLDSNSPWIPVAFSPKSDLLAVIVRDRDIAFLEVATGRVLASLESPDRPSLVRLRFTPDGTKLVALQKDCGLQVWDLRRLRAELAFMKLDWDLPAYPR